MKKYPLSEFNLLWTMKRSSKKEVVENVDKLRTEYGLKPYPREQAYLILRTWQILMGEAVTNTEL